MDIENYEFRYDAYKNNTFDLDTVEKSLVESKISAYFYLRDFQLESTGYKRFDFGMQDIYRTNNVNHNISLVPRRWVFFIDYEFINVGKRLPYKRSKLNEKDLSFDTIMSRPDLFDSTFLVFINGVLYTRGINILCKEDKTYLIINCKEKPSREGIYINDMKNFIETNAQVTIFFIPNIGIKNIDTNAYRVRALNNTTGLPNRTLDLADNTDYTTSLMYLNTSDGVSSIPVQGNMTDTGLYLNNDIIEDLIQSNPKDTSLTLTLVPLRNLLFKIQIPKGEKWFEIPMQDYPVAVENCIVVDSDGWFLHNAKITHYYPNIYCIEGVDDIIAEKDLFVHVFYFTNKYNQLKHLDMLAAYHKYVPDYLERYKNDTVSTIVKEFIPGIVDYTIRNYRAGLAYNKDVVCTYLKSSDGNAYKLSLSNGVLISELYEGDSTRIPDCYYVLDDKNRKTYRLFMIDDQVTTEPANERNNIDTVYIYDRDAELHSNLATENGILALFEYVYYGDHFKYKIIKMREFIKADVNNFRRYLRNLGLGNNYYYVDVSKIDLTERRKTDNSDTNMKLTTFDREMYMFVFRNDFRGMYDELIIHVDGCRYDRDIEIYKADMLDYVYIPCDLVKPDTVIEIEKLTDVKKDVTFRSVNKATIHTLDIGEFAVRNKTLYNDLFLVDKETGRYVDPSAYQIILPVKFHMDDIESDIILDYIITESDPGYYQLAILDHGLVEVYVDDELEDPENAFYLSLQSDDHNFYQFDMDNKKAKFNKVEAVNGYVINKIRAMDDKNLIYQFKMDNGVIKIELSEDDGTGKTLAEGGLNLIDIEDVYLQCPRELKIRILDSNYLNKDLVLQIRKNHNVDYVDVEDCAIETFEESFSPIKAKTTSKKDPRYFRVYSRGRLIPRHLGMVTCPNLAISEDIDLYPGFVRQPGIDYELFVESMPYMMKQVCYLKEIPSDRVLNLKGLIDKPFDFKWYDIYINGKKLVKKDVEIISANLIKILKSESLKNLEIVENSRDREYFGGFDEGVYDIIDEIFEFDKTFADNVNNSVKDLYDNEDSIIEIPILPLEFIIKLFYDYLIKKYGLINPDELQITRGEINQFGAILTDEEPFRLGFDITGSNRLEEERIALPINPDE